MSLKVKKKFMPIRWSDKEKEILLSLFKEKKTFEEISVAVNSYLYTLKDEYEFINIRTPVSVAYQCRDLKLITKAKLESFIKRYTKKIIKDRRRNIYAARKRVLERDGKVCIVCNSPGKLTYCHIIPFRDTRKNEEKEAVTLCDIHHKEFDGSSGDVVKKVYERMCSYYPEYSQEYSLDIYCGKHCYIKKNQTEETH